MLLLISRSITDIYQVQYAHYFEKGDIESIQETTHTIEKYSSIFFLLIIILVLTNGTLIFSIFLPRYVDSVPILHILIFVPFLSAISLPYTRQMVSGKRQKVQAIFDTINRLIRLLLILILIPGKALFLNGLDLGATGYAISILLYWIFISVGYRILTFKYFGVKPQKNIVIHFLISILVIIIMIFLKDCVLSIFFAQDFLLLLLSSGISVGIFLFILFILRELKKEDLRFLLDLLKLKNYSKSFKDEFKED